MGSYKQGRREEGQVSPELTENSKVILRKGLIYPSWHKWQITFYLLYSTWLHAVASHTLHIHSYTFIFQIYHFFIIIIILLSPRSQTHKIGKPSPHLSNQSLPPLSETYTVFDWGDFREAAFLFGIEKNSDVVEMASYAPLFVNANNWR